MVKKLINKKVHFKPLCILPNITKIQSVLTIWASILFFFFLKCSKMLSTKSLTLKCSFKSSYLTLSFSSKPSKNQHFNDHESFNVSKLTFLRKMFLLNCQKSKIKAMHDFQDKKNLLIWFGLIISYHVWTDFSSPNIFFFYSGFVYFVKTRMKFCFPIYRATQKNAYSH